MREAAPDYPGPFSFVLSAKSDKTTEFPKHKYIVIRSAKVQRRAVKVILNANPRAT
jgi:hypothetical protein